MKLGMGCAVSIINENIVNKRQYKDMRIFIVQTKPFHFRLPMWFSEPQFIPYQKLIHLSNKGWNISHKAWRKKRRKTQSKIYIQTNENLKRHTHPNAWNQWHILGHSQNNCQLGFIMLISFLEGAFEGVFCVCLGTLCVCFWCFFINTTRLFYILGIWKSNLFAQLWQTQLLVLSFAKRNSRSNFYSICYKACKIIFKC